MSLAPKALPRRGARIVLENTDPAIPIDRVPYFVSDLKKLGITAAAMVALLVGGAQLIPLVIK
jgi:ABC-type sugar transport system substrate-binding protein